MKIQKKIPRKYESKVLEYFSVSYKLQFLLSFTSELKIHLDHYPEKGKNPASIIVASIASK